ncbi:MAG: PIG-L family deacetylase [Yoonia sp.]|uniref:PIG-L family deacetylase n=1 Tax=Yoonia sp. TaxID=2212373 RepID=UPI003EF736DB
MDLQKLEKSARFKEDFAALNACIRDSLRQADVDIVVNGNVCFGTMEEFSRDMLSTKMAAKRHMLATLATRSTNFLEVGVAGGHGMLVALHANPSISCIGVDIVQPLKPQWPRTDIFVPAAMNWLRQRFPDRVKFMIGDSVSQLDTLAKSGGPKIDFVHLDAGKTERYEEAHAIRPLLADNAFLLQGDALNGHVRASSDKLVAEGMAKMIDPVDLKVRPQRLYQVLSLKPAPPKPIKSVDEIAGKKVLLCVCHQDDETLFAGHLLNRLRGKSDIHIVSFFRPALGRKDTHTREQAFRDVGNAVGATTSQLPFAVEPEHFPLRRMVPLPSDPERLRARQRRPISDHPLYPTFSAAYVGLVRHLKPDVIITHNAVGEYGHREHVFLNAVVTDAWRKTNDAQLLVFGQGLEEADFHVAGPTEAKDSLFDIYRPQWNGPKLYDFAFDPEGYVNVEKSSGRLGHRAHSAG